MNLNSPSPHWLGDFSSEDRLAIDALRHAQMSAIEAGDAPAYAALCAPDVLLLLQGGEPLVGRDAFLDAETRLFARVRFTSIRQLPLRIERSGDLAIEAGRQEVLAAGDASSSSDYLNLRKYLHVLRRTPGGWRFAVLMSNNSL